MDIPREYKTIYFRGLNGNHITTANAEKYVEKLRHILANFSESSYEDYFHHLLWFEEAKERLCLQDQSVKCVNLCLLNERSQRIRKVTVKVPALNITQRFIRINDMVLLISLLDHSKIIGKIINISVPNKLLVIRLEKIPPKPIREVFQEQYKLVFLYSAIQHISMHEAVATILSSKHKSKVFPERSIFSGEVNSISQWFNNEIARNAEQRVAVEHIVAGTSRSVPFLLHGPPGTGKTATIVEAILQIVRMNPESSILVCTPSNSAADDVACKLLIYEPLFPDGFLVRSNSSTRDRMTIPKTLLKHEKYDDIILPRITVTTISHAKCASKYRILGGEWASFLLRSFTHLFIDEAAQATEPLCLVPIAMLLKRDGLLVLSGDPLQLGPVVISNVAAEHGLGLSLMDRIMGAPLYNTENQDATNYTVMLKKNYRSHSDILDIPNKEFYKGKLQACASEEVISRRNILYSGKACRAIVFHAVHGKEMTEEGDFSSGAKKKSSSYYNEMEVKMLGIYIAKLINAPHKEDLENIGVITPYTAQVDKIKKLLEKIDCKAIEVGSVESFQGREKKIILMSTVRERNLGFVADERRYNVALTRAKAKLIVIGNPNCLKASKLWCKYIERCKEIGTYDDSDVQVDDIMTQVTSQLKKLNIRRKK